MKENLQKAHTAIDALVEGIKRLVRENGGIVDTQTIGCTRIKVYIYDNYEPSGDNYSGCNVMGIKVINDKLFVLPDYGAYYIFGRTDVKSVEDSEWYEVPRELLSAQSILSIANSIDQYI